MCKKIYWFDCDKSLSHNKVNRFIGNTQMTEKQYPCANKLSAVRNIFIEFFGRIYVYVNSRLRGHRCRANPPCYNTDAYADGLFDMKWEWKPEIVGIDERRKVNLNTTASLIICNRCLLNYFCKIHNAAKCALTHCVHNDAREKYWFFINRQVCKLVYQLNGRSDKHHWKWEKAFYRLILAQTSGIH